MALGVPVYTTFQGRMGGVDEKLLREGKLRRLENASDVELTRRDRTAPRLRRDPADCRPDPRSALGAQPGV